MQGKRTFQINFHLLSIACEFSQHGTLHAFWDKIKGIDQFTNIFKCYTCLFNKGCSGLPESLHEVCPTQQQLMYANWMNVFVSHRLME